MITIVAPTMLLLLVPPTPPAGSCRERSIDVSSTLSLGVCEDGILRIVRTPAGGRSSASEAAAARHSLMVQPGWPWRSPPPFTVHNGTSTIVVETRHIRAIIDVASEAVSFLSTDGTTLTKEEGASFVPTVDPATQRPSHVIEQRWSAADDEGLYGGGQYQNGFAGVRGAPVQLVQFNTEAVGVKPFALDPLRPMSGLPAPCPCPLLAT